jgi:hypothetical protein
MCDFSVFADHPARFDHRRDFTIIERSVKNGKEGFRNRESCRGKG